MTRLLRELGASRWQDDFEVSSGAGSSDKPEGYSWAVRHRNYDANTWRYYAWFYWRVVLSGEPPFSFRVVCSGPSILTADVSEESLRGALRTAASRGPAGIRYAPE